MAEDTTGNTTVTDPTNTPTSVAEAEGKRPRKVGKDIQGTVVNLDVSGTKLSFDFATLPADIQAKFGPFGLGHKLGDSAAGKSGQEAVDAINKVWEGLMASDWTVRAPAGEKVSVSNIKSKLDAMPKAEAEKYRKFLAALGVNVPA